MTTRKKKKRESRMCAKQKLFRIIYYPSGVVVELQYFMCQLVACDSNIKRRRKIKRKSCSLCCLRPVEYFFFFSFRPSSLLYVNYRAHRKIVFSLAGASYHSKDLMRLKVIVGIVFFFVKRFLFYLH